MVIGALKLREVLASTPPLIVWILTPRGINHAILSEEDLMLIYCFVNHAKVNWVYVMKDHMIKLERLSDYKVPYAILI